MRKLAKIEVVEDMENCSKGRTQDNLRLIMCAQLEKKIIDSADSGHEHACAHGKNSYGNWEGGRERGDVSGSGTDL
jgi:hypothetical protein